MLTYEQQAVKFRRDGAAHEQTAMRLADQACAEREQFPTFSRQLQSQASREMRTALECYDAAARAEKRAILAPGVGPGHYIFSSRLAA